jgi:para-nitrobenzyl esterase
MPSFRSSRLVLLACILVPAIVGAAADPPRSARVSGGTLQGVTRGGVDVFLGIPFAAPPVGANRWRAPQPVAKWTGVRRADVFAASCPQALTPNGIGPWSHEYVISAPVDEDCLYLNVWAPAGGGAKRPVFVWIHGGAFTSGSGSVPIYDGTSLATQGLVVVTINYRVGALGFLAHPELTREAGSAPPANVGLQDMVAALAWVRDNIGAFGGDPAAVTIAGQSAGSMAVHSLVASPLARGLFRGAIAQSGLPGGRPSPGLAEAEKAGRSFAQSRGAASLADLRAMPVDQILPKQGEAMRFGPIVDGVLLPASYDVLAREGRTAGVPMMAGQTAAEASAMGSAWGASSAESYEKLLASSYGERAKAFAAFYPATTDAARAAGSKALLRDRGLGSLYLWARTRAQHVTAPVYGYLFEHVEPGPESARWGAFHSSEMPYVFGTFAASPERAFTDRDRALSATIARCWVNFVRTGNPNGAGSPAWPALQSADPKVLVFGDEVAARPLLPAELLKAMVAFVEAGGQLSMF